MAEDRIALLDVLRKAGLEGDVDFLKQAAQVVAQVLFEHAHKTLTKAVGRAVPRRCQ